ncbi:hypothetical protein YC2023_014855 [Brassica napus]
MLTQIWLSGITNNFLYHKMQATTLNGEDPSVLLNALKIQYDEIGAKFFEYMAALEAKYQSCISICTPRDEEPKENLEFIFDQSPHFKHTVLTKTYHMIDEDEHILEKAITNRPRRRLSGEVVDADDLEMGDDDDEIAEDVMRTGRVEDEEDEQGKKCRKSHHLGARL